MNVQELCQRVMMDYKTSPYYGMSIAAEDAKWMTTFDIYFKDHYNYWTKELGPDILNDVYHELVRTNELSGYN